MKFEQEVELKLMSTTLSPKVIYRSQSNFPLPIDLSWKIIKNMGGRIKAKLYT